jgi:WD40 repeat protein
VADPFASPKLLKVDVPDPDRLAFNAANSLLAVGSSQENVVVILDLADGREVARVSKEVRLRDMWTFEIFEDKLLAIRHKPEGACLLFDIHRRAFETVYAPKGRYPQGATIDPTGRLLAVGFERRLVLYDLKKREVRWERGTVVDGSVSRPAFSPGGRYVAGDFMMHPSGGFIIVWDTANGKRWQTLEVSGIDPVVAFRGDTVSLAIGENGVKLYELAQGDDPVAKFPKPAYPDAVAFRDKGKTLVAVGHRDGLVVIDLATGREKRTVDRPSGREVGYSVPSPDWSLIASVTRGGVLVWSSGLGR